MPQAIRHAHPSRTWIRRATAAAAAVSVVIAASGFADSTAANRGAEVRWAACLRTHGVPSFPDPDRRGDIVSGAFDPDSVAFSAASQACLSVQPAGAITAVPGRP